MAMRRRTVYVLVGIAVAAALVVVCAAAGIFVVARALDDGKGRGDRTELVVRATGPDGQPASSRDVAITGRMLVERLRTAGLSDIGVQPKGDGRFLIAATGEKSGELMPQLLGAGHLHFREVLQSAEPQPLPPAPGGTASPPPAPPASPNPVVPPSQAEAPVIGRFPAGTDAIVRTATAPEQLLAPGVAERFAVAATLTPAELSALPAEWQFKLPQITCAALDARPAAATEALGDQVVACEISTKYLLGPAEVLGTDVEKATVDNGANGWGVVVEMTPAGKDKFAALTRRAVQKQVAILLDGRVVSAPTIQEPITGGAVEIHGKFTRAKAVSLAASLQSGALGFILTVEQKSTKRAPR